MSTSIQEYSKTDAALADLAARFKGIVYDVTTGTGMAEAKVARAEIRGYRVDLEKVRVEIKAPALERCRQIDAEAKRITAALVELEQPIDALIKTEESRKEREAMERAMVEQRRIDGIKASIESIRQIPANCVGKPSTKLAETLATLSRSLPPDGFAEFQAEAEAVIRASLAQVEAMLAGVQAQEAEAERIKADRAEIVKLRAEQAERDRIGREAMEAEERASRERIAAAEAVAREARAVEEARQKMERDRIADQQAAVDAAKREVLRKENERLDARGMLDTFRHRFGHLEEFRAVVLAINEVVPKPRLRA